jgi:hypothetical protein
MNQKTNYNNNALNILNLPLIYFKQIIYTNINRFKDFIEIDLPNGFYYFNNQWQYIEIKNKYIITRVKFKNSYDNLPDTICINDFDIDNSIVKHFNIYPYINNIKNLVCTIPLNYIDKVYNFIDILYFSGYTIEEPYEFIEKKNEFGNIIIILEKGNIIKN